MTGSRRSAPFCLGLVFFFFAGPPTLARGGGKSKLLLGVSVVRVLARTSASPAR